MYTPARWRSIREERRRELRKNGPPKFVEGTDTLECYAKRCLQFLLGVYHDTDMPMFREPFLVTEILVKKEGFARYLPDRNIIQLNLPAMEQFANNNDAHVIMEVVAHELAHCIITNVWNRCDNKDKTKRTANDHGDGWKEVCRELENNSYGALKPGSIRPKLARKTTRTLPNCWLEFEFIEKIACITLCACNSWERPENVYRSFPFSKDEMLKKECSMCGKVGTLSCAYVDMGNGFAERKRKIEEEAEKRKAAKKMRKIAENEVIVID